MHPDTNSPTPIDPQLTEDSSRLTAQPVTVLPTRTQHDDGEADDDDNVERNVGSEKRQKLNLWKCKQCREARKKCFPADRAWPQKCDRCLAHKPDALPCSEPELNTRKRGPNLKDKTRDKEKEKSKDKSPKPPKRSTTASTSDNKEPRSRGSTDDEDDGALTDDTSVFERPQRTMVTSKSIKREYPGSPATETLKVPVNKEDYRPASCYLPLGEGEFRILQLAPGRKEDKISCSFVTASMDKPMKYEAISYLWGAPHQKSMEIQLADSQGRRYPIFIRSHLYEALKNLRHPQRVRSFWVDALCINHSGGNIVEKNKQIEMKRYVFRNAQNLCFWLGEDDNSKTALSFIPRILDLTGIDKLVRDESTINEWAAFVTLLKNPVFSRLWLVQEVAVAQNVTLHCGQPAIHYGDLVDAVAMFESFRNKVSLLFRSKGRNYKELSDRKITIAERFIEVSTNALRITTTRDGEQKTQRLLSLEALVSYLAEFTSTNPLDRIYSVLAIAKDGPKLDERTLMPNSKQDDGALQIDYEANVVVVYQKFVIHAIESSRSLDIICRYWAGPDETLPTWVRPKQLLQPAWDSNISERTEADSLVGLPDHNNYHASRGTVAEFTVSPPQLPGFSRSLKARGFRIDSIIKLAPRASEGIILYEWLALGGYVKIGTEHVVPEEFWRTLVADRGPNGTMPPSWYARAFHYCLLHLTTTGDINTNRLIHDCEAESIVVEFLQRVQSVIWNRKFFVSKDNGWIGLAPTAAEAGDELVILHGCSVPVALRPIEEGGKNVGWLLVGECYVHGMMDGEAMELEAAKKVEADGFEIR